MTSDEVGFCCGRQAMSLLASGSQTARAPLAPFFGTSAAAGVAGHVVGRLQITLPDQWPETHRAPLMDTAAWRADPHTTRRVRRTLKGRIAGTEAAEPV
ncbi:S8 family peptidase [Methylobacterium sp. SyP6R]|uniref:S8 family peptidase n=1 Tax=Methylobacterium sp. SyP6R TaxID=2718876 RepID=UPI001F31BE5A|nr:S8 family peptidase [Methylobacterium sp. SyP6R]MCF4130172.1 S8 family peptidase [Methylobacterium sp. SyP6R]